MSTPFFLNSLGRVNSLNFITSQSANLKRVSALFCLALTACLAPDISDWPDDIPPQRYFNTAYLADMNNQQLQSQKEYLEWVLSFYKGSLAYQLGWLDVEAVVLDSVLTQETKPLARQLSELGYSIGAEWAKHNRIRLIDSRMLALWGSTLQLAENLQQQRQSIEVISKDVEDLLSGRMSNSDIVEARYEELLQLDLFDGF